MKRLHGPHLNPLPQGEEDAQRPVRVECKFYRQHELVMNGAITAREPAKRMQREAAKNIADGNL
jgi:hypothetical protein